MEELITLSQLSPPSRSFKLANTSAGIHASSTFQTSVHIIDRTGDSLGEDEEKVQLVLDLGQVTENRLVKKGCKYGRTRQLDGFCDHWCLWSPSCGNGGKENNQVQRRSTVT